MSKLKEFFLSKAYSRVETYLLVTVAAATVPIVNKLSDKKNSAPKTNIDTPMNEGTQEKQVENKTML